MWRDKEGRGIKRGREKQKNGGGKGARRMKWKGKDREGQKQLACTLVFCVGALSPIALEAVLNDKTGRQSTRNNTQHLQMTTSQLSRCSVIIT